MSDPWDDHLMEQQRAWLKLTYAERLEWLESAKRFARKAEAAALARETAAKTEQK